MLPFFVLIARILAASGLIFPHVHLASHFLFLFLLFETIEVSEYLYLAYCFVVGLVMTFTFPLDRDCDFVVRLVGSISP